MKPTVLVSMLTGKETCAFDEDTSGRDLLNAIKSMKNGERILTEFRIYFYMETHNDHRGQKDPRQDAGR